ncbi:MAG: sialate O-acetylesterase [Verrucomicrobia subdivision 3 bacterium]|nr:sialate O-acetylesterase [Limisphaerales bacterium]
MMLKNLHRISVGILFATLPLALPAAVKPAALFSDNMVLQAGQTVPVWGWADDGEVVTVKFRNQTVTTIARNLAWHLKLGKLKAGGPDIFTISTKSETVQFTNVLVGDVWVCSGQSNMEWPLSRSFEPAADIASATNRQIRLFNVRKNRTDAPTTVVKATWELSSPRSVEGFSAVGYYFGRDLQQVRRVPVGLIGTYWGGTPAEAWMSREAFEINPRYVREILEPSAAADKAWRQATAAFEKEKAEAATAGTNFTKQAPGRPWGGNSELYNAMIAPLIPYAIKGAIWYQGESNAGRAEQYRTLFPDMIRCWRRDWGQGDFPFLAVQIAPWDRNKKRPLEQINVQPVESDWAELREAQLLATQVLPQVGMAVITDVGDKDDIHPTKKVPVGARLALAARAIAYGEKTEFSGPIYRRLAIKGNQAILHFDHARKGLEARGGVLQGFAICGEDRKFVWAKAEIVGDTVVVSSPEVPHPVAVRYGWADFPEVNLWNKEGLPASPFRTDSFPMITAPK